MLRTTKETIMNPLLKGLQIADNRKGRTANGAVSNTSTLNSNVDLFSKIGALRGKEDYAWELFSVAFSEDPNKALKILFYARDVRGGQGERQVFRSIITKLTEINPDVVRKNINLFPEYGRWDDLLVLFGTSLEDDAIEVFRNQLEKDWDSKEPSLCAKWSPSINASNKVVRAKGRKLAKAMNLSEKVYRKGIVAIREKIGLLETKMSKKNWSDIDYSEVASVANVKFRAAFLRNDENRRREYLGKVDTGEAKMNTGTLYPYDVVRSMKVRSGWSLGFKTDQTLETAWKNLPNYLEGNEHNGLVVCDTSGSMFRGLGSVDPIDVAASLAVYIAERNTGDFQDYFLTFNSNSRLMKLKGLTLKDRLTNLPWNDWGGSTNLQSAFDSILMVAVENDVSSDDMPQVVYVVSDMQFNPSNSSRLTNYEAIKSKFESRGYNLPKIVWWNVNAFEDQPVTIHDENTCLVSGCNPNIFEQVLNSSTPEELMNKVIESDRYKAITI